MSRNSSGRVILVESSSGENVDLAIILPTIDRFDGKGIIVCGGSMLGSRTPLHVFDAGTVNAHRYSDEVLEPM